MLGVALFAVGERERSGASHLAGDQLYVGRPLRDGGVSHVVEELGDPGGVLVVGEVGLFDRERRTTHSIAPHQAP